MSDTQVKKKKNVGKIIVDVILWIFLVFAFLTMVFAFMANANEYGVPIIGNKVILSVETDSMEPTLNVGDLIVGKVLTPEDKNDLEVGDIVTFFADIDPNHPGKELNTHRIVAINGDEVVTKGDNAPDNDGAIGKSIILSVWRDTYPRHAGLGGILSFLKSSTGFLLVIVLPLVAFFIYELVKFILLMVHLKGGKSKLSPEEEAIRQKLYEEYLLKQQQSAESGGTTDNKTE